MKPGTLATGDRVRLKGEAPESFGTITATFEKPYCCPAHDEMVFVRWDDEPDCLDPCQREELERLT